MNTLTTDAFCASRQESGDVWIQAKKLGKWELGLIIIPKEDCMELARLLLPVSFPGPEPCYKTDFSRCMGEPE